MPKQNGPTLHRFRFQVYDNNEAVMEWIGWQTNLSASVLKLIEKSIREDGYRDVTAHAIEELNKSPRRGRPPKSFAHSDELNRLKTSDEENDEVMDALLTLAKNGVLVLSEDQQSPPKISKEKAVKSTKKTVEKKERADSHAAYDAFAGNSESAPVENITSKEKIKKSQQKEQELPKKQQTVNLEDYFNN